MLRPCCSFDLGSILTRAHSLWHSPALARPAAATGAADDDESQPQGMAFPLLQPPPAK
jgi:hypothetical protein